MRKIVNRRGLHQLLVAAGLAACIVMPATPVFGQSAENVAVVINDQSPASERVGNYYVQQRAIPAANVIHINTKPSDTISRAEYASTIEGPIRTALAHNNLHDRILFIVLTKGVPLRIEGTEGMEGTSASVDGELTLLYRRMTGAEAGLSGRIANPYFLGSADLQTARPFSHRDHDIYLVTRLDAFTVDEAIALVDRARAPSNSGRIVLDLRGSVLSNTAGDTWMREAARRLAAVGFADRTVVENTREGARHQDQVLGYYSWGSNDPENRVRNREMTFVPGAIASMFVSGDARTFEEPPSTWVPTGNNGPAASWFAGSPHSLAGDIIREGVTGVGAHVSDPFLQSTVRPEILFPAYISGFTLAEAFYLALPHLSWQSVVIGDPLCAPFERTRLTRAEIDPGIDPATELPALFSAKRREQLAKTLTGVPPEAVDLVIRAEARIDRQDDDGARETLQALTKLAPDLVGVRMSLGMLEERTGNYAAAAEQYRALLERQPDNIVALNNLAYQLGVRQHDYDEAIPLARKAVALAPTAPQIVDTLAWIEHLAGDSQSAATRFRAVLARQQATADVRLHAAIVFAAIGDLEASRTELDRALKTDPSLETSEDVAQLREKLKKS